VSVLISFQTVFGVYVFGPRSNSAKRAAFLPASLPHPELLYDVRLDGVLPDSIRELNTSAACIYMLGWSPDLPVQRLVDG